LVVLLLPLPLSLLVSRQCGAAAETIFQISIVDVVFWLIALGVLF